MEIGTFLPVRRPSGRVAAGVLAAVLVGVSMVFAPAPLAMAAIEYEPACSGGPIYGPSYVVPDNVHRLTVEVAGSAGSDGADADSHGGGKGGLGAHVTVEHVAVTPGQKIYSGNIEGGWGTGIYLTEDSYDVGRGGDGTWVAFGKPDVNCMFTGVELIAAAGGGGGGGDGDEGGPGGTGGAAGQPGNPGGNNQAFAGGGGGGGTSSSPGAGGAGAFKRLLEGPLPDFMQRQPDAGAGTALLDGLSPTRDGQMQSAGFATFGGMGTMTYTEEFRINGGGGGGGFYGGGGGAATGGDLILSLPGNGAGGGGGGGNFPTAPG